MVSERKYFFTHSLAILKTLFHWPNLLIAWLAWFIWFKEHTWAHIFYLCSSVCTGMRVSAWICTYTGVLMDVCAHGCLPQHVSWGGGCHRTICVSQFFSFSVGPGIWTQVTGLDSRHLPLVCLFILPHTYISQELSFILQTFFTWHLSFLYNFQFHKISCVCCWHSLLSNWSPTQNVLAWIL